MRFKISPSFDTTKLENGSFLDRVDVYEDRIRGWLIEPARILNGHEHAGFAVVHLVLSYVEGAETFDWSYRTFANNRYRFSRACQLPGNVTAIDARAGALPNIDHALDAQKTRASDG